MFSHGLTKYVFLYHHLPRCCALMIDPWLIMHFWLKTDFYTRTLFMRYELISKKSQIVQQTNSRAIAGMHFVLKSRKPGDLKGMQISKEDKWNQGEKHMRMRLGLWLNMQFSQVKTQKIWTYYWKPEHRSPLLLLKLQLENINTYTKCTGFSSLYFAFLPFDTIM